MVIQNVESAIVDDITRIVKKRQNTTILGNFKFGEIVCQIRSPFPEWQNSLQGKAEPELQMFDKRFHRMNFFSTNETPQIIANVFACPQTKELSMSSWESLPPETPGKEIKSFWQNGYCYVIQKNYLARFQKANEEIDILVTDNRTIAFVDMAMRFALSVLLSEQGGIILHSTGLVHDRKALVFFGASGSGKSTIAEVSKADTILSDEAVIIRKKTGKWLAYGTPFSGTLEDASDNSAVQLVALIKLSKTPFYRLKKLPPRHALTEMLKTVIILDDSTGNKKQNINNTINIAADVPIYELEFMPEAAVWPFVIEQLQHLWEK